jgi:hypothetical protein
MVKNRFTRLSLLVLAAVAAMVSQARAESGAAVPGDVSPENGSAQKHGHVLVVENPKATSVFAPQQSVIDDMMRAGILSATGKSTVSAAWLSLVSTQDVVGIKVCSAPGRTSGTRPEVAAALVSELLEAGIPAKQILVWDRRLSDLRLAGFFDLADRFKVQIAGSAEEGYDGKVFYERPLLGKLVWGDLEFGKHGEGVGRKSFVSRLVTQRMTKIINLTPLLNHNLAGVSGNLFGLAMGSIDNWIRFESEPRELAQAVSEIYALPEVGDKVVFNIVDALICQYQGEERSLLHYSTALNQLRFSTDPVALDVLSLRELDYQRELSKISPVKNNTQIYENAALLELGVGDLRKIQVERLVQK